MDRETLVLRNQLMAKAFHQPGLKHRLRDLVLRAIAMIPILPQNTGTERLLIIRPDHLGDVLLSTPAIQAIKQRQPNLSIHVLCSEWSAELLASYKDIDLVLTLPFPGFDRGVSSRVNPYWLALKSARMLRQIGYSSAIIMRPDHWWGAMLAHLAGINERIGYDLDNVAPFLTKAYRYQHQHVVKQNFRLAQSFCGGIQPENIRLDYPVNASDRDYIDKYLADWDIPRDRGIICIHPGSGAPSKIWQVEKWASVADTVASEFDAAIVFSGSSSETALIGEVAAKMKADAYIIAGATTVGQLAALYQRSLAVLGSDSGAMHVAAAVDSPTVTLFGPADPVEFAPWGDPLRHKIVTSNIACQPCRILDWRDDDPAYHPCVDDISISQILEGTRQVLSAD